jgi:hypothetical protein
MNWNWCWDTKIAPYLSPNLTFELEANHNENKDRSSQKRTKSSPQRKIAMFRALLLLMLLATGLITGTLLALLIMNSRQRLYDKEFDAMVENNFRAIKFALFIKTQLSIQVALNKGLSCPHLSDWPNCPFSSSLLNYQTTALSTLSSFDYISTAPIISPENRLTFEEFAQKMFEKDGRIPPSMKDLHTFALDEDLHRIPIDSVDQSVTTSLNLSVPITEISNLTKAPELLFYDYYADFQFRNHLDEMLQCGTNFQSSTTAGDRLLQSECNAISLLFPSTLTAAPLGFIGTPIIPYFSSPHIVGFVGTQFTWQSLLESVASTDSSFDCVIESSSTQQHHFSIDRGHVQQSNEEYVTSPSFAHEVMYGRYTRRSFSLADLTITYHASRRHEHSDFLPVLAFVSCLGITTLISGIFVTFNTLMKKEADKTETLLNSKRVFVRFISHEIRSVFHRILSLVLYLS